MNHSRSSGDSRRRGKPSERNYSYFTRLARFVNSRLSRSRNDAKVDFSVESACNRVRFCGQGEGLCDDKPERCAGESQAANLSGLAAAGPLAIKARGRESGGAARVGFARHEGNRPSAVPASGSAPAPIFREIQAGGPASITSRMPEPGADAVLVDLLGPDGLRHTVRIPCGIYAAGGQR
jgi:hypothetical protein